MKATVKYLFGILLIAVMTCAPGWAQATGQISGTVSDSTGARLPGVEVTATQTATGTMRTAVTNETGSFNLPSLPTGPYRLEAALPGFRTFAQTGITLEVNSNPVINISMEVGQVTETVEVQANAALVETRSVGVGQIMESERILELPLNGRNVTELITLSGAAVQTGTSSGRSIQGQADIRVAGGLSGSVGYTLDGALHTNRYDNLNLPLPFPDALQEFKVETSSLSASQGQSSGAQVTAVTKSGTNQFRGTAFEFLRNDLLNARQYFATKNSTLKRHQFGGVLGGPIVKNKLFFMGGYQGTRERSDPADTQAFVPTAAMLAGDFTDYASADCNAGVAQTLRTTFPDGSPTGFTNNRIDPTLFDPIALNITKRLPKAQDKCGLVTYGTPNSTDQHQIVGKTDWVLNAQHSVLGRVLFTNFRQPIPFSLSPDNILTVNRPGRNDWAYSYAIGDTWLLSPTTVVSGRLATNYTRIFRRGAEFFDMGEMGVKTLYTGYYPKYSQVSVTNGFSLGAGTQNNSKITTFTTALNLDVSMTRATHQVGVGGSVAYWDSNNHGNVFSPGNFSFGTTNTGRGLSDFLLGKMSQFEQATPNENPVKKTYMSVYVTDSWKVSPRWTLNYGLRWEPDIPEVLKQGTVTNYSDERRLAGIKSTVYLNAPPGFSYPGDEGHPGKRGREINWGTLAPRLGFAWDVTGDGKMSLRASAGIGYDYPNVQMHLWTAISPPWGLDIVVPNPPKLEDPWSTVAGGSPFPAVFDKNAKFIPSGSYTVMPTKLDTSQAQSWNLSLQRQLSTDVVVSASYLGNHIIHMLMTAPLNPGIYFPGNANAAGQCFAQGYTFQTTANAVCSTTTNFNSRTPLALTDFDRVGRWVGPLAEYQSVGNASYQALLLDVRKRATKGLTISTNYTWSHCLASERDDLNGSLLSPSQTYIRVGDRERGRTNCTSDRRHGLNVSAVAETPQFANRTLRILASGWRISPIYRIRTGSWLSVSAGGGIDTARTGVAVASQPADQILGDVYGDTSGRPFTVWLDRNAFKQPDVGTLGNMNLRTVRGPKAWQFDAAVSRSFTLRERQSLEFRGEAYNVTNSFRPDNPNTALNNQFFGQIRTAQDTRILQFALKYVF